MYEGKKKNPHIFLDAVREAASKGEKLAGLQRGKQKMDLSLPEPQSCLEGEQKRTWSSWANTKMQNEFQDYAMSAGTQDQAQVPHLAEPLTLETVQHHHYHSLGVSFPAAGGLLEDGSTSCAHLPQRWGASSFSGVSRPHWSLWMANHHSTGHVAGGAEDGALQWQGANTPTYSYTLDPCLSF